MKKVTAAITLAVSTLGSFSALAQEQIDLRISWWGGNTRHSRTIEAIRFFEKKYPHITISSEYQGGDYLPKVTTQIAGGIETDIIQLQVNWLDAFSVKGDGFYDLKTLNNLNLDGYTEDNLNLTTRNGKLHAIAVSMSGWPFYYNKTVWEKTGLDYPETWDELMTTGHEFQERLGEGYYPLILDPKDTMVLLQSYMIQKYGQALVDEENKKIAYNDEQLAEMFAFYGELIENFVAPDRREVNSYGSGGKQLHNPWHDGRWAGTYPPHPETDEMKTFLKGEQVLETGPYIMMEGATEEGSLYRPAMVFSISRNSKHPEEAAQLIDFLLHDLDAMDILGDTRGLPLHPKSSQHLLDTGLVEADSLTYQGFQVLNNLTYNTPISLYCEDLQFMSVFQEAIENMDYNDWSAERTAQDFRRKADRILRRVIRT